MERQVILVISLGGIERREGTDLGDDRVRINLGLTELLDVRLRHALLVVVGEKDRRAILRAVIRPLAVQLRRVMRDRKEDPQQLAIGDLRRIVGHLDRFRVPGHAGADHLVVRRLGVAAGVARHGLGHALDVAVHRLDAPEATARENGGLRSLDRSRRNILRGCRQR